MYYSLCWDKKVILITLLSKFETYKYFEISRLRLKKVFYGGLVEIFNSTFKRVIVVKRPVHLCNHHLASQTHDTDVVVEGRSIFETFLK